MTDYTDIPAVTTLHGEAERTQQALDMLNAGGTMSNFTIAPPAAPAGAPTMMMAVQIQVTEPIQPEMVTALTDWLTTRLGNIVTQLDTYGVGPPPPPITDPPVNSTAPVCAQDGNNLTCTTGEWTNAPTSYVYVWATADGTVIGGNFSNYPIAFADVGATITCTVSATNNIGTTQGPPSNGVTVAPPA